MKYAWAVATLLGAQFIVIALEYPPLDGDLAWQRWLGNIVLATHRIPRTLGSETYTAVGAAWTPQEWLFSILAGASVKPYAWTIFATGVAACALAAVLLTAYRAVRRGADATGAGVIAALTGTAMYGGFGVRAQVVAWMLFALMLLVLENEGPRLWACVPIAVVWANLHASAVLAPMLVGVAAVGRLWEDRGWTPRAKRAAAVACAVCAAICCTPLGTGLPLYAVSFFASPVTSFIKEWQPTNVGMYAFSLGALPLLLGAAIIGVQRRGEQKARAEDLLLFAAFAFLLFHASRNIVLFVIAVAPLGIRVFEGFTIRIPSFVLPPCVALLAFAIAAGTHMSPYRTKSRIPNDEIRMLASIPGKHRVFCANFAWCSYFLGDTDVRVFLDGRSDPYPLSVWLDYREAAYVRPRWREILSSYHVDSVIDERSAPLDQAIALTNDWRDASHGTTFRLWVRK